MKIIQRGTLGYTLLMEICMMDVPCLYACIATPLCLYNCTLVKIT